MKYVLMFCDAEQADKAWEAMDQGERDRALEQVERWFSEHADKIMHSVSSRSLSGGALVGLFHANGDDKAGCGGDPADQGVHGDKQSELGDIRA